MAAPAGSVTLPCIDPEVDCPNERKLMHRMLRTSTNAARDLVLFISLLSPEYLFCIFRSAIWFVDKSDNDDQRLSDFLILREFRSPFLPHGSKPQVKVSCKRNLSDSS